MLVLEDLKLPFSQSVLIFPSTHELRLYMFLSSFYSWKYFNRFPFIEDAFPKQSRYQLRSKRTGSFSRLGERQFEGSPVLMVTSRTGPFFPESSKVGHLSFFTIFLLAEVPLIFLSWTSWFSPSNSKVLWDHLSISGFPTEGIWSFVAVSSVNPLGFPIFLLCFLIGINVSFKHPFLCTLFMGHLHLIQGFLFSPFTVGLLPTLRGSSASFLKSVPVGPLYYCTELALLIFWVSTVGKQNMTCNLKSYWMYVRIWGIVLMGFCSIV